MEQTQNTQTEAQPVAPTEVAPQAATPTPVATPVTPEPVVQAVVVNVADWDKKKQTLNKKFFRTFSPRLMFFPFSRAIDINRAQMGAKSAGFTPVAGGMVLETVGRFWGSLMIEVEGAGQASGNLILLEGKEVYSKVTARKDSEFAADVAEMTAESAKVPAETYVWRVNGSKIALAVF